jgi:hypothetical protein
MSKLPGSCGAAALLVCLAGAANLHAGRRAVTLAVTMTNDPLSNQIKFTANAATRTISRLVGTGNHVFVDSPVAATITAGGPADLDSDDGRLGVIDHAAGQSHLSLFSYDAFGELTPSAAPINVGVANANGVAIMASAEHDRY